MRLTYKKLAKIISDKLNSVEFSHIEVKAHNPRFRSQDIEAGAATIIYQVYIDGNDNFVTMYGCQWISEIEQMINKGNYRIEIDMTQRFTIEGSFIVFWN